MFVIVEYKLFTMSLFYQNHAQDFGIRRYFGKKDFGIRRYFGKINFGIRLFYVILWAKRK